MKEIQVNEIKTGERDVLQQIQYNEAILRKIRKERKKQKVHRKLMFIMTSAMVIAVAFATGLITGRLLAFLYAVGC